MDWTGGARRRFAPGKNNAVVQKQKAHFAKARSALQNPPSSKSSFAPKYHGQAAAPRDSDHRRPVNSSRLSDTNRSPPSSRTARGAQIRPDEAVAAPTSASTRKLKRRHEVIHITSSSIASTPDPDSQHAHAETIARRCAQPSSPQVDTMNEEEKLLMANRRRLLARSDWLGLSATRPVQIRFRSNHDKDRIGKRRKVAKSISQKGRPATRRLLTPLFEERLMPNQYLMNGALQTDDVHVKIGTDALATQTQRSRQSQTPRLATGRHPSTELGPLSEEPMLLGDEGDSFEAMPSPRKYRSSHDPETVPATPMEVYGAVTPPIHATHRHRDQYASPHIQRIPQVAQMAQHHQDYSGPDERSSHEEVVAAPETGGGYPPSSHDVDVRRFLGTPSPLQHGDILSRQHAATLVDGDAARPRADDDVDDEAFWRRLMHFEDHTPINPSVDAVKSSSCHVTASDSSNRPILPLAVEDRSPETYHIPSTPKGAGTQGSLLHNIDALSRSADAETMNTIGSPSASLLQIRKLADQPSRTTTQQEKEADEDAAWRDFIIGSQDSSEGSLRDGGKFDDVPEDIRVDNQPDVDMSQLDMSGLGTSVESTAGGTQLTMHCEPHHNLYADAQARAGRNLGSHGHAGESQHSWPTREALHGTDEDDIEDTPPEPTRRQNPAAPARSSVLNPNRFKTQHRETVSSSTPDAVTRGKTRKRTMTRPKMSASIYDLVGSDGASVV